MKSVPAALFLALLAASPVLAKSYKTGEVEVADAWTRPAAAGGMAVGYFTLTNHGKAPVTLVSASSPAARAVTLHQTSIINGVASMIPLPKGLAAAPGKSVTVGPGGYHLMLEGLAKPLAAGGNAPLTLTFSNGHKLMVDLAVQTQAPAMGAMAGMNHNH